MLGITVVCMKPPCEIIVKKLLPSLRANIVKVLINDYKMKQTEISAILGITQSAVSQYITSTRGDDVRFYTLFPEIQTYAREIADKIVKKKIQGSDISFCTFCQCLKKNKTFCKFQKRVGS